jgi:hypothetical protein
VVGPVASLRDRRLIAVWGTRCPSENERSGLRAGLRSRISPAIPPPTVTARKSQPIDRRWRRDIGQRPKSAALPLMPRFRAPDREAVFSIPSLACERGRAYRWFQRAKLVPFEFVVGGCGASPPVKPRERFIQRCGKPARLQAALSRRRWMQSIGEGQGSCPTDVLNVRATDRLRISVEALHGFRCCGRLRPARAKESSEESGSLSGTGGFTLTTYRGACQHLAMRAEALSCGRALGWRGGRRFRFKAWLRRPSLTRDVKPRVQSVQICLKTAVSQPNPMDKRRRSRAKPQLGWLRVLIDIHKMADASKSCQKCQFTLT